MPVKKVIITGGSGLIGRALIDEFISQDASVIVISRNPGSLAAMPQNVKILGWEAANPQDGPGVWEGASAVINLAGESIAGESLLSLRWTPQHKQAILESRLKAGRNVVQALQAARIKPGVLVQASAVGYYGSSRRDEALDEETPAGEDFLAGVCKAWEASTKAVEDLGVRRIVIRIGVVLSRAGGALPRQALPFRFFVGGPLGNGKQWVSWIHVGDVARAVRFLCEEADCRGVYNLSAPRPVTNAEFSAALGEALGRPSRISVPAFVLRWIFGEAACVLLEGQRVLPNRLLERGFRFAFPDVNEALFNLG